MKFTANRVVLFNAFKTAAKIIPAHTILDSLKGLLLKADSTTGIISVTGTDIRTRVQKRVTGAEIAEDGVMVVPPLICDVLRLMNDDTVCLETDYSGGLKVSCGSCEYVLFIKPADDFPKAEFSFPNQMVSVKGLNALVRQVSFAAERNPDTANSITQAVELTLNLGQSNAAATDGRRMVFASNTGCSDGSLQLLISGGALLSLTSLLKADETVFCGVSGNYAVFFTQDMIFSTIPLQGKFPDMQLVEKIVPAYTAAVQSKELLGAIEAATVCQSAGDDSCINLKIELGRVLISAEAYKRKSAVPVSATDVSPTDDIGFYYAPGYITDFLKLTGGQVQVDIDKRGFLRMTTNETKYLVCPRKETKIHTPVTKEAKSEPKEKRPRKKATKKAA